MKIGAFEIYLPERQFLQLNKCFTERVNVRILATTSSCIRLKHIAMSAIPVKLSY